MANDPSDPGAPGAGPNEGRAVEPGSSDLQVRESPGVAGEPEPGANGASARGRQEDVTAEAPAPDPLPGSASPAGASTGAGGTHGPAPRPTPSGPGARGGGWHGAGPGGWPGDGHPAPNASPNPNPNPNSNPAGATGNRPEDGRRPVRDDPAAWYGAHAAARPPEQPMAGPAQHAMGAGDPRYPGPGRPAAIPGPPLPAPHPHAPVEHGRGGSSNRGVLIGVGLVMALLAGVIGGLVGNFLVHDGRGGSVGVLGESLPEVGEAASPTTPVETVAARVLPSVVQLRVEGSGSSGEGSAMVLSADGLLLTNNHVVAAAADDGTVTAVFQDGATATARIVGRDPRSDIAVIRADGVSGLAPVELGNSDAVRVGQQVVAFGAPLGLGGTVTTGIISAIDRAVNVGEETGAATPTVLNALQTDAAINPGNSGGPLVDMQGRVVGINSAIATTGAKGGSIGVGFSIPVNQAQRVAEELERTGRASWAVLGVTVGDHPQTGAIIREVTPGGAAELAGMRAGDIVLRFGDQRISNGVDLQAAVGSRAPGEVVEVQLADRVVQATLTAAPE